MEILLKDKDISRAHNAYKKFTEDDHLREAYESRLKWKLDHNSELFDAEQKGIEKGIEKGELLNSQKVLINLLKIKFDKSLSEKDTKLVLNSDDIKKLEKAIQGVLFADSIDSILKLLT